jgi:hypothetical protein
VAVLGEGLAAASREKNGGEASGFPSPSRDFGQKQAGGHNGHDGDEHENEFIHGRKQATAAGARSMPLSTRAPNNQSSAPMAR